VKGLVELEPSFCKKHCKKNPKWQTYQDLQSSDLPGPAKDVEPQTKCMVKTRGLMKKVCASDETDLGRIMGPIGSSWCEEHCKVKTPSPQWEGHAPEPEEGETKCVTKCSHSGDSSGWTYCENESNGIPTFAASQSGCSKYCHTDLDNTDLLCTRNKEPIKVC